MFLVISSLLVVNNETLTLAQAALKAKDYAKAIKLYSEVIEAGEAPANAYYFRATCYDAKQQLPEALQDFKQAIDKSDPLKNVYERSQKRILEICKSSCHLNCAKDYDQKYFPSIRTYQEVKKLFEDRKFLISNNVELQKIQDFTQTCSRDPELQQKIFIGSITENKFDVAKTSLQTLKSLFPGYKSEIQGLLDTFQIFEHLTAENYAEVETTVTKVLQNDPEESAYSNLLKIAKQLQVAFKEFEKITPNSDKTSTQSLAQVQEKLQSLKPLVEKTFEKLAKKIQSLLRMLFKIPDGEQQDIQLFKLQDRLAQSLECLNCAAQYFTQPDAHECIDVSEAVSPYSKYLKALTMSIQVNAEIKNYTKLYAKGEDVSSEVDLVDQKVNKIIDLLKQVYQAKTSEKQYENMGKFVDEVNMIMDRVFALQMKTLTPDFYKILNVSKKAELAEIKKSYFKAARTLHPDTIPKDTPADQKERMSKQYQKIAEAYDVLSDPDKRREYDAGNYNQDTKNQKQGNHASRKERAKQMVMGGGQQQQQFGMPFGGQGFQQFQFGGDPFQFFQQFANFGGQQQQGGEQGGQRARQRIIINGQEFWM